MINWEKLFNLKHKTSLLKIKTILAQENFVKNFQIINVVGTNGKGSVSSFLAQGLKKRYKKIGLFTSPHLVNPNERIQINNQNVANLDILKLLNYLYVKYKDLNFFALLFIGAMLYFQKQNIDIAVIEAGIGGHYDSTNAIGGDLGVITSIGLDHQNILGNSLLEIAADKAGIINKNMHFFVPSSLTKKCQKIFQDNSIKNQAKYHLISIPKSLKQNFLKHNQFLAKYILKNFFKINIDSFLPILGRATVFKHNNLNAIFDVGHNYHGIKALLKYLEENKYFYEQIVLCLNRQKYNSQIQQLFKKTKNLYIYQIDQKFCDQSFFPFAQKIHDLKEFYDNQNKHTLYLGSFYFIGLLLKISNFF